MNRAVLFVLLVLGARANDPTLDELTAAFSAKVLGSAVFVSGRDAEEALRNSIYPLARTTGHRPEDFTRVDVDPEKKEVTVAVKESPARTARYYGDQGVIILPKDADDIFFTPVKLHSALPDPQTQPWPIGDLLPDKPFPADVDKAKLDAALDAVFKPENHTAAFLVLYKGDIIAERYGAGAHRDMPLESWSMGKSVTAILYGRLAHQNGDWDPDQPAPINVWRGENDARGNIRIADLFRMSSGLRFSSIGDPPETWGQAHPDHIYIYSGAINVFDFSLSRSVEHPPNTVGRYRNCDPLVLGFLIKQGVDARGENYLEFPRKHLFDKLGIRHMVLETDAWGNFIMTGFDYGSGRDWARLGLLMLQDGVWQGERLLPEGFVAFVSTPAPAWNPPQYGGLFWVNASGGMDLPKTAYNMAGQGGQYVFIVPSHDLVIVRLGHQAGSQALGPNLETAFGRIIEAMPAPDSASTIASDSLNGTHETFARAATAR
jgi:CubicO group peptidase (beta-lactamase class C family)